MKMRSIGFKVLVLAYALFIGDCACAFDFDLNGDNNLDSLDYKVLSAQILDKSASYDAKYDVDGNGTIDAVDANILIKEIQRVRIFTVNGVTFRMVLVKAGTFTMGATNEQGAEATSYEKPAHKFTITKDYRIAETEVTQELFIAVMDTNYSTYTGDVKLPVESVTWNECKNFIDALNDIVNAQIEDSVHFRLPTEAEWEYAARGGHLGTGRNYVAGNTSTYGYKYPGSDNIDEVAWYWNTSDVVTHPVAMLKPNELGLFDMSGNVWEWCFDWFERYKESVPNDYSGPDSGVGRVIRGGSFKEQATVCRMSYRSGYQPGSSNFGIGFRLALDE